MNLKEKFEENRRKVLACIVLLAVLIFTYVLFGAKMIEQWPSERKIQDKIEELKKEQKQLQRDLNEHNLRVKNRESFIINSTNFWIPARDGDPEANAQKRIEEAAEKAQLQLSTIGKVTSSAIAEGISQMDVNVQAKAPVEQIMGFLEQIYKRSPRFYWAQITLSPDNIRDPKEVILNGNLRFISITDAENATKLLNDKILGEKDETKNN